MIVNQQTKKWWWINKHRAWASCWCYALLACFTAQPCAVSLMQCC